MRQTLAPVSIAVDDPIVEPFRAGRSLRERRFDLQI